jgi:hypothetical protein
MIKIASLQEQESVITGVLLSDGWLTFSSNTSTNCRLGFKQSFSHFSYFYSVFNLLNHYCSSMPHTANGKRNNTLTYHCPPHTVEVGDAKLKGALVFQTRSLPCFTELHKN